MLSELGTKAQWERSPSGNKKINLSSIKKLSLIVEYSFYRLLRSIDMTN